MHPDQRTPETHRYRAADSQPEAASGGGPAADSADDSGALAPRRPEGDQRDGATQAAAAADSDEPGSAPEVDGARTAEAGHAYTGRGVADDLKANPRVETPGAGRADDVA